MSYCFWGSNNAKYCLVRRDTKLSLMKEELLVWENDIKDINITSADIFNNGTVVIHSDKLCYIIRTGNSRMEPITDFSYDNLVKSNDKYVKFSDDGLRCMFLKYELKKSFSLFGAKQTLNDKSQLEYELILFELDSKRQTVVNKFTVINKFSSQVFWNVSKDFANSFIILPRDASNSVKLEIKRFDLRNLSNLIKPMSIPDCSISYTEMYKTGTILIKLDSNGSKGILIITPELETFNIPLDDNDSVFYLARGFVVLEKIGASSERIFEVKGFKGDTIATYSMDVFKKQNVDFEILFNDKDFLTIVYYFKDKFYFYPADVLTLTTEIRRFEMILESDKQSKVYDTGTSYFEDYYDLPGLDDSVEEKKPEKKPEYKTEAVEKSKIETHKRNQFVQSVRQNSFTSKKETPKQKVLKVSSDFSNFSIPKKSVNQKDNSTQNNSISLDFLQSRYDNSLQQNPYQQQYMGDGYQGNSMNFGQLGGGNQTPYQQQYQDQGYQNNPMNSGRLSLNQTPYQQQYQDQGYHNSPMNSGRLNLNQTPYQQQYQDQGYQNSSMNSGRLSLNQTPYQQQYQDQGYQNSPMNSGRLSLNQDSYPQQYQENGIQSNSQQISIDNNLRDDENPIYRDKQTGLYNVEFREKKLLELSEECKKNNTEFSVLRIVIDNYQNLEAHFGERYVVTMKNMIINLINKAFPSDCFVCVLSDCEFSVIMNGVCFDDAYSKGFMIHNKISEIRFTYQTEVVSSSIIIGTFPAFSSDIVEFKDLINSALIFAMHSGGNQVVTLRELIPHESDVITNGFSNTRKRLSEDSQKAYNTFLDTDEKKNKKEKVEEKVNNDDLEIKKISKLLESIEDRYLLGEINEETYKDLKLKYSRQLNSKKNKE